MNSFSELTVLLLLINTSFKRTRTSPNYATQLIVGHFAGTVKLRCCAVVAVVVAVVVVDDRAGISLTDCMFTPDALEPSEKLLLPQVG